MMEKEMRWSKFMVKNGEEWWRWSRHLEGGIPRQVKEEPPLEMLTHLR